MNGSVNEIQGRVVSQVLCEDSNTLRSLLTMRQSYTAPVNFMQVEVIRRVRAAAAAAAAAANGNSGELPTSGSGGSGAANSMKSASGSLGEGVGIADWQDCLLLTVNGIAAGMRNTG